MTAEAQPIQAQARVVAWRPAFVRSLPLRLAVFVICFLWSLPTLGLLVTSFRDPLRHHHSPAGGRRCSTRSSRPVDARELPDRCSAPTAWATPSSTA